MHALTLRLDPNLARQLNRFCQEHGYKKTGLIVSLVRKFFQEKSVLERVTAKQQKKRLAKMVGIVSLGGDSVKDADVYFE